MTGCRAIVLPKRMGARSGIGGGRRRVRLGLVEGHPNVWTLIEVNRIDESHLAILHRQNQRMRANTVPKEPNSAEQTARRDACAREDDVVARSKVGGIVNPLRISDPHLCQPFNLLWLLDYQSAKNLSVQAP